MVDYLIGVEFGQVRGDGFLDLGPGAFIQGIQKGAAYLAAGSEVTRLDLIGSEQFVHAFGQLLDGAAAPLQVQIMLFPVRTVSGTGRR